jgi:hypothetical protein
MTVSLDDDQRERAIKSAKIVRIRSDHGMSALFAAQHDGCVNHIAGLGCAAELTRFASSAIGERFDCDLDRAQ